MIEDYPDDEPCPSALFLGSTKGIPKERQMIKPDRCSFCKGKLINGKTEFIARVHNEILVVKNVSALICNECGEAFYSPDESRKIDKLMRKFHESNLLVHPIPAGELSLGEVAA